jgi:ATP-binding cassette, subfamily C, bacterial
MTAIRWRARVWEQWRRARTRRPLRTRTVLQMEAVECGAAALASILGYYGRIVPLEELRVACGVSRDGVTAGNLLRAARQYGLEATGFKRELPQLQQTPMPCVIFWNFNHFLVLEGVVHDTAFLNDPATGPRTATMAELDEGYTGVVLTFSPGPAFERGGAEPSIGRALRERARGVEPAILFAMLAGVALVIPGLVLPAFSRIFVDQVLVQGARSWLQPLLLGMALTALLRTALSLLRGYVLLRLGVRLSVMESSRFLWHVLRLPLEFFHQRSPGDVSHRIGLTGAIPKTLAGPVASTGIDLLLVVCYAALMLLYDWQLALLSFLVAGGTLGAIRWGTRARVDGHRRMLQESGRYQAALVGGLGSIETLKATSREGDFFSALAGHQTKLANTSQELFARTLALDLAPGWLMGLGSAAVLVLGGAHVMDGTLTLGMLVGFQSLQASFFDPVQRLLGLGTRMQQLTSEMGRLDDVLQHRLDPVTIDDAAPRETQLEIRAVSLRDTQVHLSTLDTLLSGQVELRDVTFGYSRLAPPLLRNFSLHVSPGARVALVGASGCGKSTVSKLLCRLYQPWSGEVLFDGIPAAEVDRTIFSASVAFVDQELTMFAGTMRETLTLWDATLPEWQVVQAARDALVHDLITARAGGYDARVEEGAANMSGGQRQRLEIARALSGNPRLLVLDEATSALDTVTEATIDRNIRRRGCSCVIVAHRLSTVRDCDEILVLDRGQVVQRGTHDDLLRERGSHYARLLDVQLRDDPALVP